MRCFRLTLLSLASSSTAAFSPSSSSSSASIATSAGSRPSGSTSTTTTTTRTSTTTSLSMALTLYGSQGSRSPLVNWAADELGLDLEMAGDMSKNPHPFGQIPCLTDEDDNVTVFESGAILNYLQSKADNKNDEKQKQEQQDDKQQDAKKRSAAVSSWIAWANASLDPICFLETPEGKVYDTGLRTANRRIAKLDEILSESTFLVPGGGGDGDDGDGFTLADVAVASYLLYVIQFFPDVDLHDKWPNVVRYMKECAGRDGYGKAFGDRVQGFCLGRLGEMTEKGEKEKKKKLFGMF